MYIFICCFTAFSGHAQITPVQQALEYIAESGRADNEEPDLVQLADQLSALQTNPISLNSATADELLEIPLFNSFHAFALIEYRQHSGRILSYYQLADVKGFTPELIQLIKPFTTLEYKRETKLWPTHFNHQLAVQYRRVAQKSTGFLNNAFAGDANAVYLRYRMQADNKLFFGITAQKDAGEEWLTNGLPDYTSMHLEYRPNKTVKTIVLGDFSAEFGQGLVLWSSFGFSKSSEAVTIQRFGKGLRHYTGADENRYLRGAGTIIAVRQMEFTAFYSAKKIDANINSTGLDTTFASSLQQSGYHRTESELADKNTLQMQLGGVYAQWKPKRLRLGFLATRTFFNQPIQFANRIENALRFAGDELIHTAVDWKWLYGRLFFFGETGYEWQKNAFALSTGLQIQAADGLQWVAQFRHLAPTWYAPYSQPFSETGREGEQGVYVGLNWQLPLRLNLAAYADHFTYLWLRSNTDKPGTGKDYMAQLNFTPGIFSTYFRVRYQERLRRVTSDDILATNEMLDKLSIRWHGNFKMTENITMQTRLEWVQSKHAQAPENGLLGFVGFSIRLAEKWRLKMRYTLFDTDSYATAIWAFEDDVPYTFSVPAYFENGQKWFVVCQWQATKNAEFWLRLADTQLANSQGFGSGNDYVEGANRTEIKALVRLSF